GLAGMYFLYEYTHRVFHIREPLIRYGLKMRKHHFYHHFGNPKLNHGVTTAFWDRVFGTYTKPDVVKVPNKLTMVWLKDNRHGLKQKYQRHFKVH
ncbi:MAG TPA: sterol desaturase family protein, partial [Chitinophagales bacterium]|nr:sterol desaturase family protein [Chitinophagales bacterium]